MKLNLPVIFILISLIYICFSRKSKKLHRKNKQAGYELSLAKIGWELSRPTGQMNTLLYQGYKESNLGDWKYIIGIPYSNPNTLVIVIRGTVLTWSNIKADIKTDWAPITNNPGECDNCNVSEGFKEGYDIVRKTLSPDLLQLYNTNKNYIRQIFVTGHSMGGALATICAYYLSLSFRRLGYSQPLSLITFGSPRVGNLNFVNFINNRAGLQYNVRFSYGEDPIPDYPGLTDKDDADNDKYIHVGTEVNFSNPTTYTIKKYNTDERVKEGVFSFLSGLFSKFSEHKLYYTIDNYKMYEALNRTTGGRYGQNRYGQKRMKK